MTFTSPTTSRNTRQHYLIIRSVYSLSLGLFGPTWVITLYSSGYTWEQISVSIAVFWTAGLITELPTGMAADLIGRRLSVVLSGISRGLGLLCWWHVHSMATLVLGSILTALGEALYTGALDSWMVDAHATAETAYAQALAAGTLWSRGAGLIGGLTTLLLVYLFHDNFRLSFLLGGIALLGTALIAGVLMQCPAKNLHCRPNSLVPAMTWPKMSLLNSRLLPITFVTFGIYVGLIGPMNQWQLVFDGDQRNFQLVWLAFAWIVVNGGSSIGAFAARKYSHWSAPRLVKLDAFVVLVNSVVLLGCAFFGPSVLVLSVLFFAHLVVTGSDGPLRSIAINKLYDGNYRASLLSVFSIVENLGGLFGLLLIDIMTKYAHVTVPTDWAFPAALMGVLALFGRIAFRRANQRLVTED
ncbi:MFS transporter [Sulfobacillus thermosulfidooxidans]|uniref:MFS transporter n=1 Tax=Sulfobacillus thermosulfidooxidans TaxID=28034 RepID=UPI0003FAADA8|nr:MFS transporter [Sulfobacillus thermosulfidooxidans]